MPDSDETRLALARIEGKLDTILPIHSAKIDELSSQHLTLAATVTQQGQRLSAVEALATERANETARRQAAADEVTAATKGNRPNWTAIVAVVVAIVMALVALAPYVINTPGS